MMPIPKSHNVIWKFILGQPGLYIFSVHVPMPIGAKILHVDGQGADAFIWAAVDQNQDTEERLFWVISTGVDLPKDRVLAPIGTFTQHMGNAGSFVWHVFEEFGNLMEA
ncbi:hypothetical protein LCGC14_1971290 [marine sediment metagenome]|uniref:DUF7352 domain-containing protein n=1 Tax=marine sediment metagenome TaxID=412755 RepID=A0A0F9FC65_9ZZZZ